MTNRISIIIPVYNTEKYLVKCLESVINQSFSEFEIIIVDDKTEDNSQEIIRKYEKLDGRIKVFTHKSNLGLGGARNTGILNASSNYICFLDSDDWLEENLIEILHDYIENSSADIIEFGFNSVDENHKIYNTRKFIPKEIEDNILDYYLRNYLIGTQYISPVFWNKLINKNLFTDNAIVFPENLYYEDISTMAKLVNYSKKYIQIEYVGYNYLQRRNAITKSINKNHIRSEFKVFFGDLYPFLFKRGQLGLGKLDLFYEFFFKQFSNFVSQIVGFSDDKDALFENLSCLIDTIKEFSKNGDLSLDELLKFTPEKSFDLLMAKLNSVIENKKIANMSGTKSIFYKILHKFSSEKK